MGASEHPCARDCHRDISTSLYVMFNAEKLKVKQSVVKHLIKLGWSYLPDSTLAPVAGAVPDASLAPVAAGIGSLC